jgi:hypothetical protein
MFAGSGVSFAHDWNDRNHKPPGKVYSHYKVQKNHPGWNNQQLKSKRQVPQRYVYKEVRDHRYYDNHQRRPAPREDIIYKVALKDPKLVFKIIVKEHR